MFVCALPNISSGGASGGPAVRAGGRRSAVAEGPTGSVRGGAANTSWARAAAAVTRSHTGSISSALRRHFSGWGESSVVRAWGNSPSSRVSQPTPAKAARRSISAWGSASSWS